MCFIPSIICILKLSIPVPAEVVTIQVYSPAWMRINELKRSPPASVTITPGVLNISPPNNQVTLAGAGVGMPDKKMPTVVPVPKSSDEMTSWSTITLGQRFSSQLQTRAVSVPTLINKTRNAVRYASDLVG